MKRKHSYVTRSQIGKELPLLSLNSISSKRVKRASVKNEYFFVNEKEVQTMKSAITNVVQCLYNDVVVVICKYIKQSLKVGILLDVYDEQEKWLVGTVVAQQGTSVGIHYNGYNCKYDDWISCQSFRIAPVHTYTNHCGRFVGPHKEFCEAVYARIVSRPSLIIYWKLQNLEAVILKYTEANAIRKIESIQNKRPRKALSNHHSILQFADYPSRYNLTINHRKYNKRHLEQGARRFAVSSHEWSQQGIVQLSLVTM